MYFGSVKFFKHLIYTVIILVLAAIIGCAVLFGVKYSIVKKENDELVKAASVDESEQPEHLSLDEYYLHMAADGYTADDVLDFLAKNESGKFDSFAEKYISENPDKFAVNSDNVSSNAGSTGDSTANEYTQLYPDLYAEPATGFTDDEKTVYLTFDDGPSENT